MTSTQPILAYVPCVCTGVGASYTPIAIAWEMLKAGNTVSVFTPSAVTSLPKGLNPVLGIPMILPRPFRNGRFQRLAQDRIETRLLHRVGKLGPGTIVWTWPGAGPDSTRKLKSAGAVVVREMINTHCWTAMRILDAEADRTGASGLHEITGEWGEAESEELALADYIVSPSAGVDASLAQWGVPDEKVIKSHFGWDPDRFSPRQGMSHRGEFVALFVGEISMRKGAHLALAAWERAGIRGELRMVGRIRQEMVPIMQKYAANNTVRHVPFTADVATHYRDSDCLFFPTLEEGAPLVCYEAAGCGLPIVTGPMGAGRLVATDVNGLIVDPHDQEGLVAALRRLATDEDYRQSLSAGAVQTATQFRWEDAARNRLQLLQAHSNG
ncbi:MAG: glycosyltransferase family 4 protein [Novosphingobium sp.]